MTAPTRLSADARKLLKGYETGAVRSRNGRQKMLPHGQPALTAYICPAGKWTIGWGHTGPEVGKDSAITIEQAEALLNDDLRKFERGVSALTTGHAATNQNQFDALVLFAYNAGLANLAKSTLLKRHRAGRYADAERQFALWNKGRVNGKLTVLPGLVTRRAEEAAIYGKPVMTEAPEVIEAMPVASTSAVAPEPPKSMSRSTTIGATLSLIHI